MHPGVQERCEGALTSGSPPALPARAVLHAVQMKEDPPCGPTGCAPRHIVNMFDPKYGIVRFGPSANSNTE